MVRCRHIAFCKSYSELATTTWLSTYRTVFINLLRLTSISSIPISNHFLKRPTKDHLLKVLIKNSNPFGTPGYMCISSETSNISFKFVKILTAEFCIDFQSLALNEMGILLKVVFPVDSPD